MALILKLVEDGVDAVDFVADSSDYALRPNGLALGLPEVARAIGGDPMLGEGQRLIDRRYGNREITIIFNVKAATHDALVNDMRAVNRLVDSAMKTAKEGLGKKITLHYQLDDSAGDELVFDVIDGAFLPGQAADPTVRRGFHLRECQLTLICEPYARLDSPIKIENLLKNGNFEVIERGGSQGTKWQYDLGTFTNYYLSRANITGLFGFPLALGICIDWPSQQSATATIMQAGDDGTNELAWKLSITTTNKVSFTWRDNNNNLRVATDDTALTIGKHFIGVCMYEGYTGAITTVLQVDENVVAHLTIEGQVVKASPVGSFYIGRSESEGAHFNGRVAAPFIIVGGEGIAPFQLDFIRKWGTKGLVTESPITSSSYWGLTADELGGVWPMHLVPGDAMNDFSGNERHLTVNGSPVLDQMQCLPEGWAAGAAYYGQPADPATGIRTVFVKYGLSSLRMKAISGVANFYVTQTVTVNAWAYHTLIFWAKVNEGTKFQISVDGVNKEITQLSTAGYHQYIWTVQTTTSSCVIRIRWEDTGNPCDFSIDGMQLLIGQPFGAYDSGPTLITGDPLPYVGYHEVKNWPSAESVNFLDVYDIPGDVPATCRLYAKNTSSGQNLGPVRIGAQFGGDPWAFTNALRACQGIVTDTGILQGAAANPDVRVTCGLGASLPSGALRFPLAALFPALHEQHGSFKIFIGGQRVDSTGTLVFAVLETEISTIPLTGDPQTDEVAVYTETHLWDSGILSWPPMATPSRIRDRLATSLERGTKLPSLGVVGTGAGVVTTADVQYIWLVPIDGGNFTFQPFSSAVKELLQEDEMLVVDTIDEDATTVGYIAKTLTLPDYSVETLALLGAAGFSMHGTGFYIPPREPGHFMILFPRVATGEDGYVFGQLHEADTMEVYLEYMPRFLYV